MTAARRGRAIVGLLGGLAIAAAIVITSIVASGQA
ncbi:hypothetical protein SAMN05428970_0072 [Agromyces sp. CF514]|nr:hypothetical protein SAMN05428970_0072 [Agromyces sp. CF514]